MPLSYRLVALGLACPFFAGLVWFTNLGAGRPDFLAGTTEICWQKELAPGYSSFESSWFPLRTRCHWADGTTTDLIPAWVNPAMYLPLGLAPVLLVAGVVHSAWEPDD